MPELKVNLLFPFPSIKTDRFPLLTRFSFDPDQPMSIRAEQYGFLEKEDILINALEPGNRIVWFEPVEPQITCRMENRQIWSLPREDLAEFDFQQFKKSIVSMIGIDNFRVVIDGLDSSIEEMGSDFHYKYSNLIEVNPTLPEISDKETFSIDDLCPKIEPMCVICQEDLFNNTVRQIEKCRHFFILNVLRSGWLCK
jgi:hypothetical protein